MIGGLRQLIFSVRGIINIMNIKGSEVQRSLFRVNFFDLPDANDHASMFKSPYSQPSSWMISRIKS
jgi:hypothetical protein